MEIQFNSTFKALLDEYDLPIDLNFQIDLPPDVQRILSDEILINEFGIGMSNNGKSCLYGLPEEQSFHEDFQNHFHVDWYVDDDNEKTTFELGVATLVELAKRFVSENINNVQLTYSFQTPGMGKIQAIEHNIDGDDDKHFISERLSFHTKRDGQTVVDRDFFNTKYYAFLIIDL